MPTTMRPSAKLAARRKAALRVADGGGSRRAGSTRHLNRSGSGSPGPGGSGGEGDGKASDAEGAGGNGGGDGGDGGDGDAKDGDEGDEGEDGAVLFDWAPTQHLVVKNTLFGGADLVAACWALRACATVHTLTLHAAGLSARQLYELADALPRTALRTVSVEFNPLPVLLGRGGNDDGDIAQPVDAAAAEAVAAAARLTAATAEAGGAPADAAGGGVAGGKAAPHPMPRRTRAGAWAHLCKRFSPLARLSLRGNQIGPAEAGCLGEALALNDRLLELVLSHNRVLDAGAELFAVGLRENRSLRMLALAQNGIGAAGAGALAAALAATFPLTADEAAARDALSERVAADLEAEMRLFPPRAGGEPPIENPAAAVTAAAAAAATAAAAAAAAAVPPPPAKGAKPDPRAGELAAAAEAAKSAAEAAVAAAAAEAARVMRLGFPPCRALPPPAAAAAADLTRSSSPGGFSVASAGSHGSGAGAASVASAAPSAAPTAVSAAASAAAKAPAAAAAAAGSAAGSVAGSAAGSAAVGSAAGSAAGSLAAAGAAGTAPAAGSAEGAAGGHAFIGAGNGMLRVLDLTNNPDVGVAGLQAVAALLAPDDAALRHAHVHHHHHHHHHHSRGEVKEAEAEEPGLRLLIAQFTASYGDKRQLSPAVRAELEGVAHRLARTHCHVLT